MKKIFLLFQCVLTLLFFTFAQSAYAQKGPPQATPVIVAPVVEERFSDSIEALGTAKANETVVVTADTSEKIAAIHFEDGQDVIKGDVLVELDKNEEEAELKAAEAELSEAQASYNRAKNLQGTKAMSQATLSERLATLKRARAAVDALEARMQELVITAPFDGVLGLREVSVGTLVQPGDRITTIDDLTKVKVDFDVPSIYLASLRAGLPITATAEAYGEKEFSGSVQSINTQIDPVTRTVRVRAVLPNPDRLLKPGLLMNVELAKDQRQALVIPEEALIKRAEIDYVYAVHDEGGKLIAKQTEVKTGGRRPGDVEIVSGLSEGDQIVVHGIVKLRDGAEVKIRATETNDETLEQLLQQDSN